MNKKEFDRCLNFSHKSHMYNLTTPKKALKKKKKCLIKNV